jgi:hypothetical protein
MSQNTVQPSKMFEDHPLLRRDLIRAMGARREAKEKYRELCQSGMRDRDASRESNKLHERAGRLVVGLRHRASAAGLLSELRSLVVSEARRLPDVLRGLTYLESWQEFYLLLEARRVAWDGQASTEFDAAVQLLRESPAWRALQKVRDKIRLKNGHWQKPKILASKRRREAARRASMTEEQKDALKASRREKYRLKKEREARYAAMLDDQPVPNSKAA